ncbi:MAG TPA: Ig-like domain-containing protein [Terracidiphilus sp.]|nr:Ig-like domain-containing protein [Terracidiphilus sp.]
MKAMHPAAATLASLFALLLAGCGDFWQNPNGSTGTTSSSVSLSAASTTVAVGVSDVLTATVSPSAATGSVSFLNNGSQIGTGTLSSGSASYTATFTSEGTEILTADYSGDDTYASSTSSSVTVTVTAASSGTSVPVSLSSAVARDTNLVLDPANTWTVSAGSHLHNIAVVVLRNGTVENIDGGGHCVYYSGKVYFAAGAQGSSGSSNANGVYELSGGGYLAPEGTKDLGCD